MEAGGLAVAAAVGSAMVARRLVRGAESELPSASFHAVAAHSARLCVGRREASAACSTYALPRSAVCQPRTMRRLALEDYDTLLDTMAANVKWGPYTATSGYVAARLFAHRS